MKFYEMPPVIASLFPNCSKSFRKRNSAILTLPKHQKHEIGHVPAQRRGAMNKTEREFSMILEARKRAGEILRYEFEGITLRFAGVKYTPDFVVFSNAMQLLEQMKLIKPGQFSTVEWSGLKFIEVKGAFIKGKFERAVERFRHARTYYDCFQFELWQKQKSGWKQIS